jgi:homoserine acetyltransferase
MDSHDVTRVRSATAQHVFTGHSIPVLGIDSDVLYLVSEQQFLAEHMLRAAKFQLYMSGFGRKKGHTASTFCGNY